MKYAIVSDIHANLAAWNAVLLDIRSNGVDCIICLGDMLGYGPRPREVLESLYTSVDHFLLGNHDAAICGKIDPQCFNEPAREIIRWTAAQLGESAKKFLSRLPLCLAGENFRCAHANFDKPAGFHYVFEPQDAVAGWRKVQEPLLFIGHTHQPGIFVIGRSQTPRLIPPEDFMLEEGKRFLVMSARRPTALTETIAHPTVFLTRIPARSSGTKFPSIWTPTAPTWKRPDCRWRQRRF